MKYSTQKLLQIEPLEVYKLILSSNISKFPKGFFSKNNIDNDTWALLTRYLIEEKLKWTDEDICDNLCALTFQKYHLSYMFQRVFGSSVYRTLDNAYPGKFKPWQLKKVPQSYWNKKTGKEATLWLIEEKFKWTDKEICENLSVNCFCKNGLNTMLFKIFNGSPYQALNAVYPGRFKPWQLASVPQKYWNEETAKEAIIWLIEENLQWSDEQLCQQLSYRIFYASGLTGMIVKVFNGSPYRAIQHAYPGKFIRVGNKLKKVV